MYILINIIYIKSILFNFLLFVILILKVENLHRD